MSIRSHPARRREAGISLIELVMFIIIVSVAIVGILLVMSTVTRNSADPLTRKQALATAESLLEEVELQAFTYCAPGDLNVLTAANAAGCNLAANSEDPPPAVTRVTGTPRLANNVGDYNGFSMSPIVDVNGTALPGLGAYTASVSVTSAGATFGLAAGDALQIDVRVVSGTTDITVTGYRFRYVPNSPP
jgi:MSHA pilin protein MshD